MKERMADRWEVAMAPTLYPRRSPLRSGCGTSPQRTRMLLEVVAKADTLVGPQDGTAAHRDSKRAKVRGQTKCVHICGYQDSCPWATLYNG